MLKIKTVKKGSYNYLIVNNNIICAFNEVKNYFVKCNTCEITLDIIECINKFREKYNLNPITIEHYSH